MRKLPPCTPGRLRYAYNTSIVPVGDNCTSWNTEHGGIQGSTYAPALVALYTNDNATRVGEARLFFEQLARCLAGPPSSAGTAQPLEMSYVTRAFAMFNSRSPRVASKQVAALGAAAETSMQAFFYKFLTQFGPLEHRWGTTMESAIWSQFGSENRDVNEQVACYIAAQYLALDPGYASRMPYAPPGAHNSTLKRCQHCCKAGCGDACCHPTQCCCLNATTCPSAPPPPRPGPAPHKTVAGIAAQWDAFVCAWLEARATTGLWIEIGSNSYWYRTWPAVLNLLDLPLSRRVRQRARMFVDLAVVEAEQASIRGVRGGIKARSKKDGAGHHDGLNHSMIGRMGYSLYGLDTAQPGGAGRTPWVNLDTNSYVTSNVSILMRELGKAPSTNGTYTTRNRLIGQVAKPARGGGSSGVAAASAKAQYVTRYLNRRCLLAEHDGSVDGPDLQQPRDDRAGAATHARGQVGRRRRRRDDRPELWLVRLPRHATGVHLGGHQASALESVRLGHRGSRQRRWPRARSVGSGQAGVGRVGSSQPGHLQLYQRRPALGGAVRPGHLAGGREGHASEPGTFASEGAFVDAVLAAPLAASAAKVSLSWGGRDVEFFPAPSASSSSASTAAAYQLPTVNGVAVDVAPGYVYRGPHLNAALGARVVTACYGDYVLAYDFEHDVIRRGSEGLE